MTHQDRRSDSESEDDRIASFIREAIEAQGRARRLTDLELERWARYTEPLEGDLDAFREANERTLCSRHQSYDCSPPCSRCGADTDHGACGCMRSVRAVR